MEASIQCCRGALRLHAPCQVWVAGSHLLLPSRPRSNALSLPLQETFARAKTWVKELQRQASPNIVIALAGNKADLANKRMVEYEVRSQSQGWHAS